MAFNGLSDVQLMGLIQAKVPTLRDLTLDWQLHSDKIPQLQYYYTFREAIDYELAGVQDHTDLKMGFDQFSDSQKFSNRMKLREKVEDMITKWESWTRGAIKTIPLDPDLSSAYDDVKNDVSGRFSVSGTEF